MKSLIPIFCASLLATPVYAAELPSPPVTLDNFKLVGTVTNDRASFTLTATANVPDPKGGSLDLLSGPVALTDIAPEAKWRVHAESNKFVVSFERAGNYPFELKFDAAVRQNNGWSAVDFRVAPSTLQPVVLRGLSADTQFEFTGAARPEREGDEFRSFLPADGSVKLAWKEARPEAEGKLFYAAEMLSQISVAPGLMRQVALLELKVMQGELNQLTLVVHGAGEVTRVHGDHVLAWNIEPVSGSSDRRLVVQFNQSQKDEVNLQIHLQTPIGAFPQSVDAPVLRPEGATRFAGTFRVVNEGAVRLEVTQATGLSQISPDKFPESDATKAAFRPGGSQRFAYRFSGGDFALRIQADQILPELALSELLAYRLGDNELAIDAELELEIRDAPLRELVLRVPKGYAVARLNAANMNDYFLTEPEGQPDAELRLVFGQPVSGRQVVQLRLERNKPLAETTWALPRIEVPKAKSIRGHLAVAADPGYRLSPERTQGLTEIATAFFPRKVLGIQSAFRLSDPAWQAALRVERLPQTVQADALHLFSIGEGIAYGSSLINYVVSGAPVSAFRLELSDEYYNVEFTGKDIRNWQKTEGGYVVQLHTPVSGPYTLLATYERPFKSQGETLTFTGARPLQAQSEQGHTIIISAYQFQVKPEEISPGLLALEPGEVPPEYRLFFDAPILAAYRYSARPFNLKLALSPLAQGDSLSQVVDRALLTTRISKEGQVLTDVRYFVKNRGHPNFRLSLPAGTDLWSASVNGLPVVPVKEGSANLLPLPQGGDANAVLRLDLKLATRSREASRVALTAPTVNAPVMLAEWDLEPDTGQRLLFHSGSLMPVGGIADASGFAQLTQAFTGDRAEALWISLATALLFAAAALVLWRWASQSGVFRGSARHVAGIVFGLVAAGLSLAGFFHLAQLLSSDAAVLSRSVHFLAPVQQAGSAMHAEVWNFEDKRTAWEALGYFWPGLLGVIAWVYALANRGAVRTTGWLVGSVFLGWAVLRWPNSAPAFVGIVGLFVVVFALLPALRQLWRVPCRPEPPAPEKVDTSAASAAVGLILVALLLPALVGCASMSRPGPAVSSGTPARAESVLQKIRIEDKFALGTATMRWQAEKDQALPLLCPPAVLVGIKYPTNELRLTQVVGTNSIRTDQLIALRPGLYEVEARYQLPVTKKEGESGLELPARYGLVNQLELTVAGLDVDIASPEAVSIQRDFAESNTVAKVVLAPADNAWIGWKPRTRDVRREKPVFYAEASQLYVPSAGVIEGAHWVSIRPAQGELSEIVLNVPPGATITDVTDGSRTPVAPDARTKPSSLVGLWRFDPDTRKLRVTLNPAQSRPFALLVRSQLATGPLPVEQSVGLLSVDQAAGQVGLFAVGTGSEVQLDDVAAQGFSAINLEDFPTDTVAALQAQNAGLAVRRAFRYADLKGTAVLKASAVEPDVRVETQDTVSLGEDRTVLAADAKVDITRAGIFRLSFVMPPGFDVESISGSALSHWTELKTDAGRVITLHLNGKTEGQQQFAISLAGPGVKATNNWPVPQVVLREAAKQRGTLLLVPEQGLRLQVHTSEGLTQLDPQKSGIKQKGVLAFRVLQTPRTLTLDLEQVDPWIQVTSLQHASVGEAQVKIAANLQYEIDNTGVKSFRVYVPTNAEGIRFQGDQVADFVPVDGAITNGLQLWEIKLHRRVIGSYLLQANYQTPVSSTTTEVALQGIQAVWVNLQRGFVTVQSGGRLSVSIDSPPTELQPAEWQSIPRALQAGLSASAANYSFRLVEPAFNLPLKLERREAVKLLAARVNEIRFNSVVSDDGVMLTQARLDLVPGDKRLLSITLPKGGNFWFAFVNQNGVWPWREGDSILIPLEKQSRGDAAIPVEIFYSCKVGTPNARSLDLQMIAPKFDLPLENITWRVSLSDKWHVENWDGSTLQLQGQKTAPQTAAVDVQNYLQTQATQQRELSKKAEDLLAAGNSAIEKGEPLLARRAFAAAYGLSTHDSAFNEDARVQLHNIKLQQALIGLNVRQSAAAGDAGALGSKFRDLRGRKEINYTQQDAKDIIDRNSADENAAFMRLAERLIQQQDAAVSSPTALRASIPDQGRVLTFKRAVLVDPKEELRIDLQASAPAAVSSLSRVGILIGTLVVLGIFAMLGRRQAENAE